MTRIGVFSPQPGRQANDLIEELEKIESVDVVRFDLSLPPDDDASLFAEGLLWNESDLAHLDAAFLHGFGYMNPVVPEAVVQLDFSVWRADHAALQQRYSFLFSLFSEMEERGVKMVNPMKAHLLNFTKIKALNDLRRSGFQLPRLICTNDMEAASAFCEKQTSIVWRPTRGSAAWQLFQEKQRKHLINPQKPPILLAEALSGYFIRSWLFEGEPLLILAQKNPAIESRERLETLSKFIIEKGAVNWELLSQTIKAPWAMVSMIAGPGGYWIYDVDVDPHLEWLPKKFYRDLLQRLAGRLAGRDTVEDLGGDGPQERPTPFLRRILRILFEFEASKYKDAKP